MQDSDEESASFCTFKDCLARRLLARLYEADSDNRNSDLDEFTSYLASEVWPSLPHNIRNLALNSKPSSKHKHLDLDSDGFNLDNTSSSFSDTLVSYGISSDIEDAHLLLRRTLDDYIKDVELSLEVPVWSSTRALVEGCEICERDVPLTYHHLIPRSVHAKVLKRNWHPEEMLGSVAWLCRQCHSAVHGVASNETLAREFYTVDLLLSREDIQRWAKYAAKQRYGQRRG